MITKGRFRRLTGDGTTKMRSIALAVVLGWAPIVRANLLVNGDFENPVVGHGSYNLFFTGSPFLTGWNVDSSPRGTYLLDYAYGSGSGFPGAYEGSQYLELNSYASVASVSQAVNLVGGLSYDLSLELSDFRQSLFDPGGRVTVDVQTLGGISILASGPTTFSGQDYAGYAFEGLTFLAPTDGTYRVS
ncbi:MAG: hypothetical protein ACHQ50_10115, partial [Fimbriimonadales bacterium]